MSEPAVTIALVPREVFSTTQRTLETLYERTDGEFELVCVDGGSPPEIQAYLQREAQARGFTLLRTEKFLTPNQARNLALQHVRTPYVAFVDNDVVVSRDWLRPLVQCAEQTGAWVVGPLYCEHAPEEHRVHMAGGQCRVEQHADGRRYYYERHEYAHQPLAEISTPLERHETELIEFHAVLIAMEAFGHLGQLDEGVFCHAEHGDLCLSVRAAGESVYLEPKSRITYIPPKRLAPEDREFYFLRWSETWAEASIRNFAAKWQLTPEHAEIDAAWKWLRQHRRYGYASLSTLRKVLGRKLANSVQKRMFDRMERRLNRRRYPVDQFGRLRPPEPRLIHSPHFSAGQAA